jgi:hypothetical protein
VDDLDRLLCAQATGDRPAGHVAVDGKRLRGSRHGDNPGLRVLVAYCTELTACLGSFVVPPDSDELPEAIRFLKTLPLSGATRTMDAAFTHPSLVEAVREAGVSYFLMVKDNQPNLKALAVRSPGPGGEAQRLDTRQAPGFSTLRRDHTVYGTVPERFDTRCTDLGRACHHREPGIVPLMYPVSSRRTKSELSWTCHRDRHSGALRLWCRLDNLLEYHHQCG